MSLFSLIMICVTANDKEKLQDFLAFGVFVTFSLFYIARKEVTVRRIINGYLLSGCFFSFIFWVDYLTPWLHPDRPFKGEHALPLLYIALVFTGIVSLVWMITRSFKENR